MFCTKCGKETMAGDAFCQHCGAPVRKSGSSPGFRSTMGVTPVPTPPPDSHRYGTVRPAGEKSGRELYKEQVHQTIREHGKSVVFLVTILFYTMAVLFQLFESSTGSDYWMEIMDMLDLPYDVRREIRNMTSDGALLISIMSMMPQFLTVLSLWLIFGGSFAKSGHGSASAGLVILKVLEVIRIVFISLIGLVLFIAMVSSCSAVSEYSSDGSFIILLTFSVLIGAVVLLLILSAKTVSIYDNIRFSMSTGSPNSDLSAFVAVMIMMSGTINVVSIAFAFSWYAFLMGIAQVMFGLQIFFYRSSMVGLENNAHLYKSSYLSGAKTDGSIPTWKRLAMENDFEDRF